MKESQEVTKSHEDEMPEEQQFYYQNSGEPFKSVKMVNMAIKQKSLDPDKYKAVKAPDQDGYCIKFHDFNIAPEYRGYWQVRFNAKTTPNDSDDVQLMVNGETLIIQREKKVVLPGRFLENADHATYLHFRQVPHQPRKIVGKIKTYPYERICKATKNEYEKQRVDGTKKTKQNIKKYGYDVDPEDISDEQ